MIAINPETRFFELQQTVKKALSPDYFEVTTGHLRKKNLSDSLAFIAQESLSNEVDCSQFESLKERISDVSKKNAEITWLLHTYVMTFIEPIFVLLESTEKENNNLSMIQEVIKNSDEFARKCHEAGKVCPLGGIFSDLLPTWYTSSK